MISELVIMFWSMMILFKDLIVQIISFYKSVNWGDNDSKDRQKMVLKNYVSSFKKAKVPIKRMEYGIFFKIIPKVRKVNMKSNDPLNNSKKVMIQGKKKKSTLKYKK